MRIMSPANLKDDGQSTSYHHPRRQMLALRANTTDCLLSAINEVVGHRVFLRKRYELSRKEGVVMVPTVVTTVLLSALCSLLSTPPHTHTVLPLLLTFSQTFLQIIGLWTHHAWWTGGSRAVHWLLTWCNLIFFSSLSDIQTHTMQGFKIGWGMLRSLTSKVGLPLAVVRVIRNPFNQIASNFLRARWHTRTAEGQHQR